MISGSSTLVASEPGSVLVNRIRHLLSSSVPWPSRLTWTTGVRAVFWSLSPAMLEICTSAVEVRLSRGEASPSAQTTTLLV